MITSLSFSSARGRRLMRSLSAGLLPSAVAHWLGVRAISIAPEQIAVREGLRAGLAVGLVMIVAVRVDMPLMAWSAFSAFWTCLVDPGGLLRPRLAAMLKFNGLGTLITGIVSAASGAGMVPAFLCLGLCVWGCIMLRRQGPVANQIGVLAAIVAVVAVCYPQVPSGSVALAGLFFGGSVWATLVCVLALPVDPYMPLRQTCAAIFREQGRMTGRLLDCMKRENVDGLMDHEVISSFRRDIRSRIELARSRTEALSDQAISSSTRGTLLPAVEICDRLFIAVMAFEHAVLSGVAPSHGRRIVRLVTATLHRLSEEVVRPQPRPENLGRYIASLEKASATGNDLFSSGAEVCALALKDLQQAWTSPGTRPVTAPQPGGMHRPPPPMRLVVRHASRVAVAVITAYALALYLALPYAYWAMMAVVVVTQPSAVVTLPRTIERVAGSIAGGLLAALAGVLLPMWATILVIFPLAAATIALRGVNYTLCVMFMSQLFVLVTDLVAPAHGWDVGLARSGNNILGSLIGLAACLLLWPEKKQAPLAAQVMAACVTNLRFAALACCQDQASVSWASIEKTRREAGTTSTRAEISCQQARVEGLRRSEDLLTLSEVLFLLRRLAGAASVWWMESRAGSVPVREDRATGFTELADQLAAGADVTPLEMLYQLRRLAQDTF